ncbi:MAG TPA: hypothetical protein ENJ80_05425 [Gammaproteobacteria bacterium]|nr:hypothetical protein [Gammaproteobacteria bacterium]
MRRILIQLLTLSILFSNMAWAMDECALFVDVPGRPVSQEADTPSDDSSVNSICDTYCIGWAQLLCMSYQTSSSNIIAYQFDVLTRASFYHSLQRKPPTEPPQA